jgi:hypothetical protein
MHGRDCCLAAPTGSQIWFADFDPVDDFGWRLF